MIMRKRAELDTVNPPGQVINRDQTIGGIIDRIMKDESPREVEPKKLTFDEWLLVMLCQQMPQDAWWWKENGVNKHDEYFIYKSIWEAAQANK